MLTGNDLIDSLDDHARQALLSRLRRGSITAGEVLINQGEPIEILHFPSTAYFINRVSNGRGETLQVTFVGREGVSGLAPFLADAPCSWSVIAQGEGEALIGSAREIRALAHQVPTLLQSFLRLAHFYQAEAHQLALASTYDAIAARLSSWLLMAFDLSGSREITVTQEAIAQQLGVQRTTIVESYRVLAAANAVKVMRGRVTLIDEGALRRASCGSFDLIREMARRLGGAASHSEDDGVSSGRLAEIPQREAAPLTVTTREAFGG